MTVRCVWPLLAALLAGCAAPSRIRVALHMRPGQEDLYRTRILKPFEKRHHCVVELSPTPDPYLLPERLAAGDSLDLVSPPLSVTRALAARGLVRPLDAIGGGGASAAKTGADLRREFFLVDLGAIGGKDYFLPRHLETPVVVYLKSKVAEAVQYWEVRRDEINRALARYNGRGLPRGYALEPDPSQWDFFDLFVAGWYWGSKEVQGRKRGRMALGPLGSPFTPQFLMDAGFLSGAGADGVLAMDAPGVADMFQWQSVLAREGIFNPGLLRNGWNEEQIRKGFADGELYLSAATQVEAFLIHGTGNAEAPGWLADPEDMGTALMPQGNCLLLDAKGDPLREGRRSVATRSYWWAVPRGSRNPALALELARYLSGTENQVLESSVFGTIPARQDLLGDLGLMFGGGWTAEVFQTASRQIVENRHTFAPLLPEFARVAGNYREAFAEICLPGPAQSTDYGEISKALRERWAPRQRAAMTGADPGTSISVR